MFGTIITSSFLLLWTFQGHCKNYSNGIIGNVSGHGILLSVQKDDLKKILIQEFELDQFSSDKLLLLFFKFEDVRPSSLNLNSGLAYQSLYVLVPNIKLRGTVFHSEDTLLSLPIGFMNNHFMTSMSRRYNGLNKKFADIFFNPETFGVIRKNKLIVWATFTPAPPLSTEKLHFLKTLINSPILSDRPIGSKKFGISTALIDWTNSLIQPIAADVIISDSMISGLGPIHQKSQFAFSFKAPFSVSKFTHIQKENSK